VKVSIDSSTSNPLPSNTHTETTEENTVTRSNKNYNNDHADTTTIYSIEDHQSDLLEANHLFKDEHYGMEDYYMCYFFYQMFQFGACGTCFFGLIIYKLLCTKTLLNNLYVVATRGHETLCICFFARDFMHKFTIVLYFFCFYFDYMSMCHQLMMESAQLFLEYTFL
jgi:hypothetical protein